MTLLAAEVALPVSDTFQAALFFEVLTNALFLFPLMPVTLLAPVLSVSEELFTPTLALDEEPLFTFLTPHPVPTEPLFTPSTPGFWLPPSL